MIDNKEAMCLYNYYRSFAKQYESGNNCFIYAPTYQKISLELSITSDIIRKCHSYLEDLGLIQFFFVESSEKYICICLKLWLNKENTKEDFKKFIKEVA